MKGWVSEALKWRWLMGWVGEGFTAGLTLWAPLRWAFLRSSGRWGVVRGRSPPSYEYGRGGRGGTESDSYTSHRTGKWRTLLPDATTNPKRHKRLSSESTTQVNTLVLRIWDCVTVIQRFNKAWLTSLLCRFDSGFAPGKPTNVEEGQEGFLYDNWCCCCSLKLLKIILNNT